MFKGNLNYQIKSRSKHRLKTIPRRRDLEFDLTHLKKSSMNANNHKLEINTKRGCLGTEKPRNMIGILTLISHVSDKDFITKKWQQNKVEWMFKDWISHYRIYWAFTNMWDTNHLLQNTGATHEEIALTKDTK